MDISEEVLFSTLAQITNKDQKGSSNGPEMPQAFEVVKNTPTVKKVDVQYTLERKIIEILLLYGDQTVDFEDLILKENEKGQLELEPIVQQSKVFEKVFLDLQEDEMEFLNPLFKDIYFAIIETLNQNPEFKIESIINTIHPDLASEITSILMEDERYELSDWERNNIFPKTKKDSVAQLVSETILTLRCFLIDQKVLNFQQQTLQNRTEVNRDVLEEVKDYSGLKMLLARKLNRAL